MFRYYAQIGLTRDEFLLIQHLATYRYEDPNVRDPFPGLPQLAREMGYAHENSVSGLIKSLEGKGMLIVERRPGRTSIYNFAPFARQALALHELEEEAVTQPPHPSVVPQSNVPHPSVDEEDDVDDVVTPNIFTHYHGILGLLVNGPYEKEYLEEIEGKFPLDWIEDSFKLAVKAQARKKLPYAVTIMEGWAENGKDAPKPEPEPAPIFDTHRTVYR